MQYTFIVKYQIANKQIRIARNIDLRLEKKYIEGSYSIHLFMLFYSLYDFFKYIIFCASNYLFIF